MPDNARTMKYTFQTEFDPRGVRDAKRGVDDLSSAFNVLGSQMEKTNFGRAFRSMTQFHGMMPGMNRQIKNTTSEMLGMTSAAMGLGAEVLKVETGMEVLQGQFKAGLIDKAAYQEGIAQFRLMRSELKSMTADQFAQRQAANKAFEEMQKNASQYRRDLEAAGVPQEAFMASMEKGRVDARKLRITLQEMGWAPTFSEASEWAAKFNNIQRANVELLEESTNAAKKLSEAMSMRGALLQAGRNIRQAVVSPFKDAYEWATRIPTRMSEGLKEGIAGAFSDRGFIRKSVGRLFNKGTIMKTLAFGPLGLLSGVAKKQEDKDRPGFASGAGQGGILGALGKNLTSFGGIIKTALGAFGPAALILKALEPALRTLMWALQPLIAPLQIMLTKLVMGFIPFIEDLSKLIMDLTKELLPPFMDLVKALGPIFIDIAKAILPPVVKLLKLTASWIKKVAVPLVKLLLPALTWVADKVVWVAEAVMGALSWLGNTLLDMPVIGWALKKLGISSEAFTAAQQDVEASSQPGTEPKPGVSAGGAYLGEARAMTVTEAGGAKAFREFTEPRGIAQPIIYKMPEGQMQGSVDRRDKAMTLATAARPEIVERQDPDELSEPVVRALKDMKMALLTILPKRIGQETKSVSLADFSAVTA